MSEIVIKSIPAIPSMLSFRRRVELSDARLFSVGPDGGLSPITSYLHCQRTPKSHDQAARPSTSGGDAVTPGDGDNRNLVQGYRAKLPTGSNQLAIRFEAAIFGLAGAFDSCDSKEWSIKLPDMCAALAKHRGGRFAAECLAYNFMSACWAWRNRDSATAAKVTIKYQVGGKKGSLSVDDVLSWPPYAVATPSEIADGKPDNKDALAALLLPLADAIYGAFTGATGPVRLSVEGVFQMIEGQEVWASQLRIDGVKQKTFFRFGAERADAPVGIVAEKLGNALRTFDRFHGSAEFANTVVPFESNGGSVRFSLDLRDRPDRIYSVLPRVLIDLPNVSDEHIYYVIGFMLRGGVVVSKDIAKAEAKAKKNAEKAAKVASDATPIAAPAV